MTTFQAIVHGILHGVAQFIPVSVSAHHELLGYLFDWDRPAPALLAGLAIGAFAALLVQIRHDWIAVLASGLKSLLLWKKPMTIDERMPLFLFLAIAPYLVARQYIPQDWIEVAAEPLWAAAILAAGSLFLLLGDRRSRQNKRLLDWTWIDATIVGLFQVIAVIPTVGLLTPVYSIALLRNFSRESGWQFSLYILLGLIGIEMMSLIPVVQWGQTTPAPGMSWLSWGTATGVSTVVGYLTIGAFMNVVQSMPLTRIALYRIVVSGGVAGVYWLRATILS